MTYLLCKGPVIVKKNHIVRIDNETTNDLSYKFQKIVSFVIAS